MLNWRRNKKIDARRRETLCAIHVEREMFEVMLQRARRAGDIPDQPFVEDVLKHLAEIQQAAKEAASIDELDTLVGDAERQGQLRAYVCPVEEIADEGSLALDVMEEWNVPRAVVTRLRDSFLQRLGAANNDSRAARSALRSLFEEYDSWEMYTDDYEATMHSYTYRLFGGTVVLALLSLVASQWGRTVLIALFLAGATGSCASVMAKMPVLDVSLSGELGAGTTQTWRRSTKRSTI